MKAVFAAFALITTCSFTAPACADIPTIDAAQLTEHSQTASATVNLVPITTQRQDANSGVKCAMTTGKKANVSDPTLQPQMGAGAKAIQGYAPDMPATPDATARGAALNSQSLFKSSGDVVAGLDASGQSLSAARTMFQAAGQQVGTAPTVMGAFDLNSAARLQNNLAWNSAIGSANLWVTALNAPNLAQTSDMSRAAMGMRSSPGTSMPVSGLLCPAGMAGSGTAADPCRQPASCSTTPPGTPPDPACVAARATDSSGNVAFFLARNQDAAQSASPVPSALSATDVNAALAAMQANAR
ncbi:hypothetical protein [Mesorhizobium sp. AR07]|uniref:hypothetical protein n=1 Tax=Mesorhizobium sp. AR07 TaxID=2865838 RepID=UPI00215EFFE4|nr:hypothetical protein [Mesorhizobium sp. AR07]